MDPPPSHGSRDLDGLAHRDETAPGSLRLVIIIIIIIIIIVFLAS
jgi:hypothetical protein